MTDEQSSRMHTAAGRTLSVLEVRALLDALDTSRAAEAAAVESRALADAALRDVLEATDGERTLAAALRAMRRAVIAEGALAAATRRAEVAEARLAAEGGGRCQRSGARLSQCLCWQGCVR